MFFPLGSAELKTSTMKPRRSISCVCLNKYSFWPRLLKMSMQPGFLAFPTKARNEQERASNCVPPLPNLKQTSWICTALSSARPTKDHPTIVIYRAGAKGKITSKISLFGTKNLDVLNKATEQTRRKGSKPLKKAPKVLSQACHQLPTVAPITRRRRSPPPTNIGRTRPDRRGGLKRTQHPKTSNDNHIHPSSQPNN